jgi:hypothetical protein
MNIFHGSEIKTVCFQMELQPPALPHFKPEFSFAIEVDLWARWFGGKKQTRKQQDGKK